MYGFDNPRKVKHQIGLSIFFAIIDQSYQHIQTSARARNGTVGLAVESEQYFRPVFLHSRTEFLTLIYQFGG